MHSLSDQIYDTDLTRLVLMFALLVLFIRSWEKFNTSAEPIEITVKLSPVGQRKRILVSGTKGSVRNGHRDTSSHAAKLSVS